VAQMERDIRGSPGNPKTQKAPTCREFLEMELAGLEPATSWVRSRLAESLEMADLQVIQ
jgi:hypothetical protein